VTVRNLTESVVRLVGEGGGGAAEWSLTAVWVGGRVGMKRRSAEHEGDCSARNRSPVWLTSHFQPVGEIPKKSAPHLHQDVHDLLTGQDTD
jgi:hypothetical protein